MVTNLTSGLVLAASIAWRQIVQLGPYVLGGVALAALLSQLDLLRRWHLPTDCRTPLPLLGATCLGILSPISTYGTIPILHEMLRAGASPAPVLAFLTASSMLNPQLFLITLGGLGPEMAAMQVVGVIGVSLVIGSSASAFNSRQFLRQPSSPPPVSARHTALWFGLLRDILRLVEWIGFTFLVGVSLAALIQVFVPTSWISSLVSGNRWGVTLLSGILSIPLYTCGGAAVPILAQLIQSGMGRGAVLAFLITGAATRVTAIAAVGSILSRRALVIYIAIILAAATLIGMLF
jgi:uncharacterized membrane protein YraQ (UPF0718 family)